jgi:hypothetical protein
MYRITSVPNGTIKITENKHKIKNKQYTIYRVSQEERSIFWEVIVSVILSKRCICTYVLFRTASERELFHCTLVWIWRPILAVVTVNSDIVGVL